MEAHAPGGESLRDVEARLTPSVRSMLERLADGNPGSAPGRPPYPVPGAPPPEHPWTIVVAHDGVFKVLLLTLFGLPLERFWLFPFALCGITVVELAAGRPRLRAHNLTEHLAPLLDERAQEVTEERERAGAL
jgi:broad specificity phosphatase PhoE